MFKNSNWKEWVRNLLLVIVAMLAGAGGPEIKNMVLGDPSAYAAAAPDYSKLNFITDGGSDQTAPYSAIYRVAVYAVVNRVGGGGATPEVTVSVPVLSAHTIKIHGPFSTDKVKTALEQNQALPYGGVLDKVWNTEFVMWVKRASAGDDGPTPVPDPPTR